MSSAAIYPPERPGLFLQAEDDDSIAENMREVLGRGEFGEGYEIRRASQSHAMLQMIHREALARATRRAEDAAYVGERVVILLDLRLPLGGSNSAAADIAAEFPELAAHPALRDIFEPIDPEQPRERVAHPFEAARVIAHYAVEQLADLGGVDIAVVSANASQFLHQPDTVLPSPGSMRDTRVFVIPKPYDLDDIVNVAAHLTAGEPLSEHAAQMQIRYGANVPLYTGHDTSPMAAD